LPDRVGRIWARPSIIGWSSPHARNVHSNSGRRFPRANGGHGRFSNLPEALYLYFHSSAVWTQGIRNTPWVSWDNAWTISYFATLYVIIVLTALAFYCRGTEDETELAKVIGGVSKVVKQRRR
jgi:hypothetical protein